MPDIDFIRADIEHRRRQVQRLRGEIRQLRHSGISSPSTEALLDQMLDKLDQLCAERDRLKKEQQDTTRARHSEVGNGEPDSTQPRAIGH
jgi:hypothetical protein